LVTALFVVGLVGCAEKEKPIDVPGHVQDGVLALLKAVDPDVRPEFAGETCNTDPLADPPDDHRWRMKAKVDGTPEDLRAAGLELGWQPERAEDGTLLLANYHQFGEPVEIAVRAGGDVLMVVEKSCTRFNQIELGMPGVGEPELTEQQGERLGAAADEVDDLLADVRRELRVQPKEDVSAPEIGPGGHVGCAADKRSGALWTNSELDYAEITRYDELAPAADRFVAVAEERDWRIDENEPETDGRGNKSINLALTSEDGRVSMTVDISFWGKPDATDGVRLHVTGAKTTCVAVDAR
jgi:hypothetical protein